LTLRANTNWKIMFSAQIVSDFGNSLYRLALPWYVLTYTGNKSAMVLSGVIQWLPAIFGMFAGVWVDRWNKKRTMIYSDAIRAALTSLMFLDVIQNQLDGWYKVGILVGLVLCLETMGTFFGSARTALTPKVVSKEDMQQAMGYGQSSRAFSSLVGQLGGGALIGLIGAPLLFLLDGISFVASFVSLFFIRVSEEKPVSKVNPPFLVDWLHGLRQIIGNHNLRKTTLLAFVTNIVLIPLNTVLIVAWVHGPMHGNGTTLGIVMASMLAGTFLGGLSTKYTKKYGSKRLIIVGCIITGLSVGVIGLITNLYGVLGSFFVAGLSLANINAAMSTTIINSMPSEMRGRISGAMNSLNRISVPLGLLIFSATINNTPLSILFVVSGVIVVMSSLVFVQWKRDHPDVVSVSQSKS